MQLGIERVSVAESDESRERLHRLDAGRLAKEKSAGPGRRRLRFAIMAISRIKEEAGPRGSRWRTPSDAAISDGGGPTARCPI